MHEVLFLSPDRDARVWLTSVLRSDAFTATALDGTAESLPLLRDEPDAFGLVVLDLGAGGPGDADLVRAVREAAPRTAVVALRQGADAGTRRTLCEAGAVDVFERGAVLAPGTDGPPERLALLLRGLRPAQALRAEVHGLRRRASLLREFEERRYAVAGTHPVFLAMVAEATRLAAIPRPVLVVGERGTGKEMVAATMHFAGPRATGPFITVNCAAFQGALLDAELFGHEKGAFTGADRRRLGRFELADGGTLFLDEIGNMSADFQEKILRVIEYQEFERVQGSETVRVSVRVVAGTNADLPAKIAKGEFRADLYDRLAFAVLRVPPLRERAGDIPVLVEHFVVQMCREVPDLQPRAFTAEALAVLAGYAWPGNVRELRNVVERCLCAGVADPVRAADLPPELRTAPRAAVTFLERVEGVERQLLREALDAARGSQKRAAEALALTYDQFRHLLRKYDLKADA